MFDSFFTEIISSYSGVTKNAKLFGCKYFSNLRQNKTYTELRNLCSVPV